MSRPWALRRTIIAVQPFYMLVNFISHPQFPFQFLQLDVVKVMLCEVLLTLLFNIKLTFKLTLHIM